MTIQEAIKKAIEGGWNKWAKSQLPKPMGIGTVRYGEIFMDKDFWSCLGRAMGWRQNNTMSCPSGCIQGEPWVFKWHSFIDHLASGKSAEEFFGELK